MLFPMIQLQAKIYHCPQLPINIAIGKRYANPWYAWTQREDLPWLNQTYYKLFPAKYHFQSWTGFVYGKNKLNPQDPSPSIACCETQIQEKNLICLYRKVKEKNCMPQDTPIGVYSYICPEQNQKHNNG